MDMGIKTKGGRGHIGTEVKVRPVDDTAQHHQVRLSTWFMTKLPERPCIDNKLTNCMTFKVIIFKLTLEIKEYFKGPLCKKVKSHSHFVKY